MKKLISLLFAVSLLCTITDLYVQSSAATEKTSVSAVNALLLLSENACPICQKVSVSGKSRSWIWKLYGYSEIGQWYVLPEDSTAFKLRAGDGPLLTVLYDAQMNVVAGGHAYSGETLMLEDIEDAEYVEVTTFNGLSYEGQGYSKESLQSTMLNCIESDLASDHIPSGWNGNSRGLERYFELIPEVGRRAITVLYEGSAAGLRMELLDDQLQSVARGSTGFGNGCYGLTATPEAGRRYTLVVHADSPGTVMAYAVNTGLEEVTEPIYANGCSGYCINISTGEWGTMGGIPAWQFGDPLHLVFRDWKGNSILETDVDGDELRQYLGVCFQPSSIVVQVMTNCMGGYYVYNTAEGLALARESNAPCCLLDGEKQVVRQIPALLKDSEVSYAWYVRMPNNRYVHVFKGGIGVLSDYPIQLQGSKNAVYRVPASGRLLAGVTGFGYKGALCVPNMQLISLLDGDDVCLSSGSEVGVLDYMLEAHQPCVLVVNSVSNSEYVLISNGAMLPDEICYYLP